MCLLLFFGVVYLRSSVLAGRCLPAVLTFYLRCYRLHGGCGFEFTSGGSCGRACNTRPRIGTFTCGATWTTTCGAITSAVGVHLSIPPVAPADVPALFHPRIRTFTCGAEMRLPSGGCIPPVAVAQCLARRLPFRKLPAVLSPPRRVCI